MKKDNSLGATKLHVRNIFLRKYHPQAKVKVLDCCSGQGWIWKNLKRTHPDKNICLTRLDKKSIPGVIKCDSIRYLKSVQAKDDIYDIDTYGSPVKHIMELFKKEPQEATIFLTYGRISKGGFSNATNEELSIFGLDRWKDISPRTLLSGAVVADPVRVIKTLADRNGLNIIELIEGFPIENNTRYYAMRIKKL